MSDGTSEKTGEIGGDGRDGKGRFGPGNPGKPKGARHKLGEQFLTDLQAMWQSDGAVILAEVREKDPVAFAKIVASLMPKELLVRHDALGELTEAEIDDRLDALEQFIADARGGGKPPKPTHATQGHA